MEKIVKEVAEQEFDRFAEMMDLDFDESSMDEEDLKSFQQQKRRLVLAIQSGSLVIDEKGQPVFTPQRSDNLDPITFYEPTGASLTATDKRKKGEEMAKMFALMASATRTAPVTFSKMKMADFKVCQAIINLFFG